MYVVTNREIDEVAEPVLKFGTSPDKKGIENIRLAKVKRSRDNFIVEIVPENQDVTPDTPIKERPSFKVFRELQANMQSKGRNCVFFVHGYNVNFKNALESAYKIEKLYQVEVILFAWPARGAGEGEQHIGKDLLGTLNYKRDKKVAARSIDALDKCFELLGKYIMEPTDEGNHIDCGQSFNLLCHSMGNYVFKKLLDSSIYSGETLLFDNVILCAADVNHPGHEKFIDKISHRRRVYVTINENDYALNWSRRKLGEEQLTRLGHSVKNLTSQNAVYLDFTDAQGVGKSHSYFMDQTPDNNKKVKDIFKKILNGERAERSLSNYDPNKKIYKIE